VCWPGWEPVCPPRLQRGEFHRREFGGGGPYRVTIVVEGPSAALDQVAKQFRKLIGAVKVADVTTDGDQLAHEMLLVKVAVNARTRQEVVNLATVQGRIVDVSSSTLMLEATANRTSWPSFSKCSVHSASRSRRVPEWYR